MANGPLAPTPPSPSKPLFTTAGQQLGYETWMPVVGWERLYRVSDYGHVECLPRRIPYRHGLRLHPGGPLKPYVMMDRGKPRALQVSLSRDSVVIKRMIHQLVLEAFVGPCPAGMEGCHDNGDPTNNRLDNLRWDTRLENMADAMRHRTFSLGEDHYNTHLTIDDVRCIVAEPPFLGVCRALADAFGVDRRTIGKIRAGQRWGRALEWANG